jgi:N-acetyl-anhydromuramyl-L-alanine amidase AmpD
MAKIEMCPSPNWNERPAGIQISGVLLHATASRDELQDVDWCRRPKSRNPNPVSYHNIIGRRATIYSLVDPLKRAWHAGVSLFRGVSDCNDYMIGVAFANDNTGAEPYPSAQLAVGAALVAGYARRFPAITLDRITTHAIVREEWRRTHPEAAVKDDPRPPAFDLSDFRVRVQCEMLREVGR